MNTKLLRTLAIVFAALAMGMHLAHALELFPKLHWPPDLYIAVQSSLYTVFGAIGPVLEIGALIFVSLLVRRFWSKPSMRTPPLISATSIVLTLLVWVFVVLPANIHLSSWALSHVTPSDWERWRDQWQFGQTFIFVLHVVGFASLTVGSVRQESP